MQSLLRQFEHSQVYQPSAVLGWSGAELGRPFEDVCFKTSDGVELNGWFYPANPDSPRANFVFLFCHGNGGNISYRLDVYRVLLELGPSVFAFDYRGYGRSKGRPTEAGTYLDAQASFEWLRKKGFAPHHIIVFGESLGGGVASELCSRERAGGLVLQGTFTSMVDLGAEIYRWLPARRMMSIQYRTLDKLPFIKIPVLIMHSPTDDLVRIRHAELNYAAANQPKLFREIAGPHHDPLADPGRFRAGLEDFLQLFERTS
jgi:uncharacterized protein